MKKIQDEISSADMVELIELSTILIKKKGKGEFCRIHVFRQIIVERYAMRILITGSNGMLGTDIREVFANNNELIAIGRDKLDITDLDMTATFIRNSKPDVIIHPAAYTDVDGCEKNPEHAFRVNSLGARNVAISAQAIGASLAYISTDYVYDGTKDSLYREYDAVNPLSIYGKSKLEGENFVKSMCDKYYILRTSWLFGKNGKNFVKTMLELSKTRDSLQIVDDQFGSPTYTKDLAEAIASLIKVENYGTYHLTNSEYCSWFEFTNYIFEVAGIKNIKVEPIDTEALNRPAPRPKNSRLEKFYWKLNGFDELRSYKEATADYIKILMSGGL